MAEREYLQSSRDLSRSAILTVLMECIWLADVMQHHLRFLQHTQQMYLYFSLGCHHWSAHSLCVVSERARVPCCCKAHKVLYGCFCSMSQEPDVLKGTRRCLNLGSYNYLGFAAADEYCTPRVLDTLSDWGVSTCSSRTEAGRLLLMHAGAALIWHV